MKNYAIQHDFLYKDLPIESNECLPHSSCNAVKMTKLIPIKLSFLLKLSDEKILIGYARQKRDILLLDDVEINDNKILSDYKKLLIRAVVFWFGQRRIDVYMK